MALSFLSRVDEIARLLALVRERGVRGEVLAVLALLVGEVVLFKDRSRELRLRAAHPPSLARDLTVAQAAAQYPVSRSFLYERGEDLGIAHRPNGTRKLVVKEEALRRFLEGRTNG